MWVQSATTFTGWLWVGWFLLISPSAQGGCKVKMAEGGNCVLCEAG